MLNTLFKYTTLASLGSSLLMSGSAFAQAAEVASTTVIEENPYGLSGPKAMRWPKAHC